MRGFKDRNWGEVENIQEKAGAAGLYESFTEAGPQSVVQSIIILSTAQKVSLPISICSLTMASSRAFFIQGEMPNHLDSLKCCRWYMIPSKVLIELTITMNTPR